jgi:hypothetical protein
MTKHAITCPRSFAARAFSSPTVGDRKLFLTPSDRLLIFIEQLLVAPKYTEQVGCRPVNALTMFIHLNTKVTALQQLDSDYGGTVNLNEAKVAAAAVFNRLDHDHAEPWSTAGCVAA